MKNSVLPSQIEFEPVDSIPGYTRGISLDGEVDAMIEASNAGQGSQFKVCLISEGSKSKASDLSKRYALRGVRFYARGRGDEPEGQITLFAAVIGIEAATGELQSSQERGRKAMAARQAKKAAGKGGQATQGKSKGKQATA